jgi:hypothetical protein
MDNQLLLDRSKAYGFAGIAFLGWMFWVFIAVQLAFIVLLVQTIWYALLGKIFGFLGPSITALLSTFWQVMMRTFIPIFMRFAGLQPPQELEYLNINRMPWHILATIKILSKPNNITFALGCLLPFYLLLRYVLGLAVAANHAIPAADPATLQTLAPVSDLD